MFLLSLYKLILPTNFHTHYPLLHLLFGTLAKRINSFLLIEFTVINQVMKLNCLHVYVFYLTFFD